MSHQGNSDNSGYASWKEKFPDFCLVAEGKELKCHKSFLARNSPVMDRMLSNEYVETNTGQMEIKNFDAETVTGFLQYIYAETTGAQNLAMLKASTGQG